ncbi:DUF1648 domain-containing protein [Bacillus cytotoxicus]|uniref:DUF1648 domain-containing protein n=1 Tax=Bacillus cytotoxicus TaxID=580165 RepID=UPI003D7EE981
MVRDKYMLWIFLTCLLFTLFLYPYLPYSIAVHWNQDNEPNEFARKQIVVFLIPCFIIAFHSLLYIISKYIPKMDRGNQTIIIEFKTNITVFLLFIHMLVLFIALGMMVPFQIGLTIGISVFLFMTSKSFKKMGKEKELVPLQKICLLGQRVFCSMAYMSLCSLLLRLEWGMYVLISIICCGAIFFLFGILYSYLLANYET